MGFQDNGDYHLYNGGQMLNLLTLMVSATPYNFFTSSVLQADDLPMWNEF
jgi:hypothetical protein